MKTHYSPKTKKIERCSGKCLYGEVTPHFQTLREGNDWLRNKAAKENPTVPDSMSKKNATVATEQPQSDAESVVEESDQTVVNTPQKGLRAILDATVGKPGSHPLAIRPAEPVTVETSPIGLSDRTGNRSHNYDAPVGIIKKPKDYYSKTDGEIELQRPLVVAAQNEQGNWVDNLRAHYKTTGAGLTEAIKADGYDSVLVASGRNYEMHTEIIDLREYKSEPSETIAGAGRNSYLANVPASVFNSTKERYDEELNVTIQEHSGTLVDNRAYARTSISGTPDWSKMDESWSDKLGMPSLGRDEPYLVELKARDEMDVLTRDGEMERYQAGASEMVQLESREQDEINQYTAGGFVVNLHLLAGDAKRVNKTESIERLDAALQKAPKQNRVVYRGMNGSFLSGSPNNIRVGDELKFDGYQSSSLDPEVAFNFAANRSMGASNEPGGSGVILEISTPEGLNVQSVSNFINEQEVLLPRGSKYVVVGKYDAKFAYAGVNNAPVKVVPVLQLIAVNDDGEILDGSNYQTPPIPTTRSELLK